MINKILFKFGATEDQPALDLEVTPITVFVGPNNSGKSRVLIEIENYCRKTIGQPNDLVISQLESWVKKLGATGYGSKWLIEAFEKMGESPSEPNYLNPQDDDVWSFIGEAKGWLADPNRKGIPSS
ncbi:MAG: ATP-binding protein [Deltaproteobacteria bacterium]|nr:ATP-binding protein [Deltaproteobacteria bacterium]